MRSIKFRGKRLSDGEWMYGYYFLTKEGRAYIIRTEPMALDWNSKYVEDLGYHLAEVIPETVGQYTGLKDKNGREIFEGDIVNCVTEYMNSACKPINRTGKVIFKLEGSVGFVVFVPHQGNFSINEYMWDIKVIGNVHQNPELLQS